MTCRASWWKLVGMLLLGALMVAVSGFCVLIGGLAGVTVGAIGVLFFGFAELYILWHALRGTHRITLTDEGIRDHRWSGMMVPWDQIDCIDFNPYSRWLGLQLKEPGTYLAQLPLFYRVMARFNQRLDFLPLYASFTMMKPDVRDAAAWIAEHRPDVCLIEAEAYA